jgi:predicted ester cyclase
MDSLSDTLVGEGYPVQFVVLSDVNAEDFVGRTDVPIFRDPTSGVQAWKELVAGFLTAFPDIHFTGDERLVDGDRVAFRWHAVATHTGPLGPVPPTGRKVAIDGLIIDHVVNGRVVERWEQMDQSLMLQQLGLA